MNKKFTVLLCLGVILVLPGCGKKEEVIEETVTTENVVRNAITKEIIEQA